MRVTTLRCRNCGAYIEVPNPNMQMCYCQYCGSQNWIDNGNRTIHKCIERHDVDEAAIIKAKTEYRNIHLKWLSGFLLGLVVVVFYVWLFWDLGSYERDAKNAEEAGKITAGNSNDYEGENYESVEKTLKKLGFTNVTSIDLDDSGLKFWTNKEVESVSIDGDTSFDKYDYYEPDTTVIIKYH